jgi:type IV pilus assembly protein PilO
VKLKKPLPRAAGLAMIGVGGLLLLVVGWLLVVSPQKHKAANLKQQAAAVRQKIADELAQAAVAKSATAAPKIKVADVYRLAKAMPSIDDMPDILLELNQTAKAAGVDLLSLSPSASSTAATGGPYSTIPLALNVTGDFYTITDLLYRLRNLVYVRNGTLEANGRLFSVNNVSIGPGQTGRQLNATISVDTYVYGGGAASSTAVPAGTSTTTTTTTSTTTTPASSSGPSAAGAP